MKRFKFLLLAILIPTIIHADIQDDILDAASSNDIEAVRTYIIQGANVNHVYNCYHYDPDHNEGPLEKKLKKDGNLKRRQWGNCNLDDFGFKSWVYKYSFTLLEIAAIRGHTDIVRLLLEHGATPEVEVLENYVFDFSIFKKITDILFEYGYTFTEPARRRDAPVNYYVAPRIDFYVTSIYQHTRNDRDHALLRGDTHETIAQVKAECESHNPIDYVCCALKHSGNNKHTLMLALVREEWDLAAFLIHQWNFDDYFLNPSDQPELVSILAWFIIPTNWNNLVWRMREEFLDVNDLNHVIQQSLEYYPDEMATLIKKIQSRQQ